MAYLIVCDVCEKQFSREQYAANPAIEATIPAAMLGDLETAGDDYLFCSWACLADLVDRYVDTVDGDAVDQEADEQEEVPAVPPTLPETPAPPIGVYFPEGMKVDGRDPNQHPAGLRRVR